jgi:predicted enzyme related to lactoylglutathione lyase
MIKVTAFAYTAYPVTDLARARHFYENLLGLVPTTNLTLDGGNGWIEYEIGDSCLAIANGFGEEWKPASAGPTLVLEVADITAATVELKAAGVKFKFEPIDFPACQLAIVLDPDGNYVGLHHKKAAA